MEGQDHFGRLLEQDAFAQKKMDESKKKDKTVELIQDEEERRIISMIDGVLWLVQLRFPRLRELAEQKVQTMETLDEFTKLFDRLLVTNDRKAVRALLEVEDTGPLFLI